MKPHVLYSVLDWGLGHATRSVPILKALEKFKVPFTLAGSGISLAYLREVFPDSEYVIIPDKKIKYHSSGAVQGITKRALAQSRLNKKQNTFLEKFTVEKDITHSISDNVYGAHFKNLPSVLITHQLGPKAILLDSMVKRQIARWMERFDKVWIPDHPDSGSLAGELIENPHYQGESEFIGLLSRFHKDTSVEKDIELTVLLGGPEPQRSLLEKKAVELCHKIEGKKLVLRASFAPLKVKGDADTHFIDFADGGSMNGFLNRSRVVLSRSGYSSMMDLIATQTHACLVPTPGQSEQEYLAKRATSKEWFSSTSQESLSLKDVKEAFEMNPPPGDFNAFLEPLKKFLEIP